MDLVIIMDIDEYVMMVTLQRIAQSNVEDQFSCIPALFCHVKQIGPMSHVIPVYSENQS